MVKALFLSSIYSKIIFVSANGVDT